MANTPPFFNPLNGPGVMRSPLALGPIGLGLMRPALPPLPPGRSYTVRVLIKDASVADYGSLWDQMDRSGFTDEIRADDGSMYKLPPGEYDLSGTYLDISQVREIARQAARATGREHSVLVTEATARTWFNLSPV